MRRRRGRGWLAAAFLLVAPAAGEATETVSSFVSGEALWRDCNSASWQTARCFGYVAGIIDAMGIGAVIDGRKICIPRDVSLLQATDVVVAFLRRNGGRREHAAAALVAEALAATFPCP